VGSGEVMGGALSRGHEKDAGAMRLRRGGLPLHLHALSLQIPALGKASGALKLNAPLPSHLSAILDLMGYSQRSACSTKSQESSHKPELREMEP